MFHLHLQKQAILRLLTAALVDCLHLIVFIHLHSVM